MGISIKILGGIGIAASLAFGANLPVMAATVSAGSAARTVTTTDLTDIGFKITNLSPRSITATWDASKTYVAGDNTSSCDITLGLESTALAGATTGEALDITGNTVTFNTHEEDGQTVNSVSPGQKYSVNFQCYSDDGWQVATYRSATITTPDVPVNTPDGTKAILVNDSSVLAVALGGTPAGEEWATSCLFRLYKNGSLIQSKEITCTGGTSYAFSGLAAGSYTVTTALRNSAGLSGWSPASNVIKVAAGAATGPVTASKTPATTRLTIGQHGTKLRVHYTKVATQGNGKIAGYNVNITKQGNSVYKHNFKGAATVTKKLAHGSYKITVTVTNVHGGKSVATATVKL